MTKPKLYLIRGNERIWIITEEKLATVLREVANHPVGECLPLDYISKHAIDTEDLLRFDFDEEFDPWEELARVNTWPMSTVEISIPKIGEGN